MNLLKLSVKVGKELEKVCSKLGLDDYQKDIIDESIMSVFNKEISLKKQGKENKATAES